MTDVIVPSLRCSVPDQHPGHLFGTPPGEFRCEGEELRPAVTTRRGRALCPFCRFPTLRPYTPLGEHRGALFCDHCYRACAPPSQH